MKDNITSLLDKIKQGDLSGEITKVQVLGLPGLTWVNRSEFKKAEKELKKALAQVEKRDGPDHPATALISYFLGDAYMRHGRPMSAETHFLKAMEIWAETDEENFKAIIHKLLDLTEDYGEAGDVSSSERLGRTIVDSVKNHLSEGDSLIVSALVDLAVVLQEQGRVSEAEDLLHEALRQSEQNTETLSLFGPRVLMNLAGVSTSRREFPQAGLYLDRALEIAESAEKRDAGHVLEILCSKAKVCFGLENREQFDRAVSQALQTYETAWENDPEVVIQCLLDLIRLHEGMKRYDIAEEIASRLTEAIDKEWYNGNETKYSALTQVFVEDLVRKGVPRVWRTALPVFHTVEPNVSADRQ